MRAGKKKEGCKFLEGNGVDGKHYWLTPDDLMEQLKKRFGFDFDPCPYPKPDGFDGLEGDWGDSNYVNPPFGSILHQGKGDKKPKKKGPTAWARKAIKEHEKGKRVAMVYPIDKWVLMLLAAGAKVENLGDVRWCATEDGSQGKGTGRHIAMFVLDGEEVILEEGKPLNGTCGDCWRDGNCDVQDRAGNLDGWKPFGCIHWKPKPKQ